MMGTESGEPHGSSKMVCLARALLVCQPPYDDVFDLEQPVTESKPGLERSLPIRDSMASKVDKCVRLNSLATLAIIASWP
jgi:hypothetical protein